MTENNELSEKQTEAHNKKAEREEERRLKKEQKEAEKAAKKAEREANRMPQENGIRRPKPNTLSGQIWSRADTLSEQLGGPVSIKALVEDCQKFSIVEPTIRTQYAKWRKFYGITGRITAKSAA